MKSIFILGLVVGIGFVFWKLVKVDFVGVGLEIVFGVVFCVFGVGIVVFLVIDIVFVIMDIYYVG